MIPDVALWFAKNSKGVIKTIDEVKYHDDKYYCPLCNSEVIPKALRENSKVAEHFAHLDRSKCTPESMIHWWYKNKFIQSGDKFIVTTDKSHTYVCKYVLIEQTYHTEHGDYKPDVTIVTDSGETIYFEYAFTNTKKIKDYLDKWLELGNIVVEVDLRTLLQANYGKDTYNFHALFYDGKCFNTNKRDLYYKTIGKYKEQVYLGKTLDDDKKMEIENLDWFWNSVQEYKLKNLNDDEFYLCFDKATEVNFNLVKEILIKSKCTNIYELCMNIRQQKFLQYAKNILYKDELIDCDVVEWGKDAITVCNVKIDLEKDTNEICKYIIKVVNNKLEEIDKEKILNTVKNNFVLEREIAFVDSYVKTIDSNYSFYGRFGVFGLFLTLCYDRHTILDVEIDKKIACSKDINQIKPYLSNVIVSYFNNLEINKNKSDVIEIVKELNYIYNKISYQHEYEYKVRRHLYKKRYETHTFQIEIQEYSPECFILWLNEKNKDEYNSKVGLRYTIFRNKLYLGDGEYEFYSKNCNDDHKLLLNDTTNFSNLKRTLMDYFSTTIRNIKFKEC